MKKIIAFIFLMAITALPAYAYSGAARPIQAGYIEGGRTAQLYDASYEAARDTILAGLLAHEKKIDVSDACFNVGAEGTTLSELVTDLINSHPELYYVRIDYSYSANGSTLADFLPRYFNIGASERAAFDTRVQAVLAECIFEGMSDADKALSLHDYLVTNIVYDVDFSNEEKYSAYGALIDGDAVCQGYTLAYMLLLQKAGVESVYVRNNAEHHIWNAVKIDGTWYHVDVTSDDPVFTSGGVYVDGITYVAHNYLLRSDDAIKAADLQGGSTLHRGSYITSAVCPSDSFYEQGYPMYQSYSRFHSAGGGFFYGVYNDSDGKYRLHKAMIDGSSGEQLTKENTSLYPSLAWRGDFLYFISEYRDTLMRYDITTKKLITVYEYPLYATDNWLFAATVDENCYMTFYSDSFKKVGGAATSLPGSFTGDCSGSLSVSYGAAPALPTPPDGYVYAFTVGTSAWDGSRVTNDVTVTVSRLCDAAELSITNLDRAAQSSLTISGECYKQRLTPVCTVSDGASYKIYTDALCSDEVSTLTLSKGANTFYIKVWAQSGREVVYTIEVLRPIPDTLGHLEVTSVTGGNVTFELQSAIAGSPVLKIRYGTAEDALTEEAAVDSAFGISGLMEDTEYYFKAVAVYDEIEVESDTAFAKTTVMLSGECSVLRTLTPLYGVIDNENGVIYDISVPNSTASIAVDVEVSHGATWELYYTTASSTPIADKTLMLYEGAERVAYIKVTAEDGNNTKTYAIKIYRRSKSAAPEITVTKKMATIKSEGSVIYTLNGEEPTAQSGLAYTKPFAVTSGTVIKAIAKEDDKDEYSSVVTFTVSRPAVPEISALMIMPIGKTYLYEFYIEAADTIDGTFFVALYDADGALTGICTTNISGASGEYLAHGSVTAESVAASYKAFLWAENSATALTEAVGVRFN